MITVLFFAQLAESAQARSIQLDVSEPKTAREVAELAAAQLPEAFAAELFDGAVMVAVNKRQADWQTTVEPGDEVAFLPPFSGG